MEVKRVVFNIVEELTRSFLRPMRSYPTSANGIIVLLIFLKLQTSGYYNWILVNFILNIKKRPDINVTSGKPMENHMTCALVRRLRT